LYHPTILHGPQINMQHPDHCTIRAATYQQVYTAPVVILVLQMLHLIDIIYQ
jgi:hypothetical protein